MEYETDRNGQELMELLQAGVSPYHTVEYSAKILKAAGFSELPLDEPWTLEPGHGYYVRIFGATLVGFVTGKEGKTAQLPRLRVCASHTDWPCLMVKPSPELAAGKYGRLNVSVYGGPILNTWLDRPLSLAGRACIRGADPFHPEIRLFDFGRPLLTIPNLPIHFNREVNKGVELNPQVDMLPLLGMVEEELNRKNFFQKLLARELGVETEDLLDYECCLYNCDAPQRLGLSGELLSSPRLDNLTSVQACLRGISEALERSREFGDVGDTGCEAEQESGKPLLCGGIRMAVLYHNEEIGSATKQGAASPLLERILEKIYISLGYGRAELLDALFGGLLLSMDVAHAIHPNRAEKYDPVNRVFLGDGVALKLSVSQSYATDASYVSAVEGLCRERGIPYKKFSNRSDIRGGSTLGSIASSLLNMPAVDVGVPILAMHSAREVMAIRDQEALARLAGQFLTF